MQATAPAENAKPRGNADQAANEILESYFAQEEEKTPESEGEDSPEPEMVQEQAEESEPEREEAEPEEGEQHYTLAELAEHLELDPAALYAAEVAMPDGTRIPVGQMKDEWQAAQKAMSETQRKAQELEQARAHIEQQQQMMQAASGMQLQPDEEEQQLYADLAAYDRAERDQAYWDAQAKQDPGAAALAMQRLQGVKRDLQSKLQAKAQERQGKAQQQQQEFLRIAQQEIRQRIPEWKDESKIREDWNDINQLWNRFGLPQHQVEQLWQSPAAMHLSHSFLQVLRQLSKADPEKKKVLPIRNLKAGKRGGKPKDPKTEALVAAAKKGNRKAQDAVASAMLKDYLR